MTREEAIKKAINIVAYCEAHFAKSKESREDAANIIKALEQEPCEDCCNGNQEEKAKLCQKSYLAGMEHRQEPCEDVISRQAVLDEMYRRKANGDAITAGFIKDLPPVTPQPKTGHWRKMVIVYDVLSGEHKRVPYTAEDEKMVNTIVYTCDCGCEAAKPHNYCPNCGAKMEESEE